MNSRFKHYPERPSKLTAAFAKNKYQELLERVAAAEKSDSPDLWLKLYEDWNELSSYIGSEGGRINHNYNRNMADADLERQDRYFREKIYPAIADIEHQLTKSLLDSRHRVALADKYGNQLLVEYETALRPMDPVNTELRVKAGNISSRYGKVIAKAELNIAGKTMNLSQARSLSFSDNRQLRREAFLAVARWVLKNQEKLSGFYSGLVDLRDKMASNLNYENYVPMAYELRGRQGYGPAEVENFRNLVLRYAAPLFRKYQAQQAEYLKLDSIRPWDVSYNPKLSIPLGTVPIDTQLKKAEKVFSQLSPRLKTHFNNMRRRGLIDLETRPNKKAGAYCTSFTDEQAVAILCNSTGDPDDVRVLMHEMGHAFQALESQHIEAVDLRWGTAELAEVYSMGMEFLSLPYVGEFFNREDAKKFSAAKWENSLYTLCYVCVVDEFQHWVYQNPDAPPVERDRHWEKTYTKYLGGIDYTGIEKYKKTRWYLQSHIFEIPFYYIDYALAEVAAMQLALLAEDNHSAAVAKYLELCRLGGTKSFLDTLKSAGLESPFQEKVISRLMRHIGEKLV